MLVAVLASVGNKLIGIAAESSATAYDTDLDEARAAIAKVQREARS